MSAVPKKTDPYTELQNLPENLVGEIIGGELYSPYQKGRGGLAAGGSTDENPGDICYGKQPLDRDRSLHRRGRSSRPVLRSRAAQNKRFMGM